MVEIGTDSVQIVADTTTNAPTGLSTADSLGIYKGTYTTWNAIPDNRVGVDGDDHPGNPAVGVVDLQDIHRRPDDGQRWHGCHLAG